MFPRCLSEVPVSPKPICAATSPKVIRTRLIVNYCFTCLRVFSFPINCSSFSRIFCTLTFLEEVTKLHIYVYIQSRLSIACKVSGWLKFSSKLMKNCIIFSISDITTCNGIELCSYRRSFTLISRPKFSIKQLLAM